MLDLRLGIWAMPPLQLALLTPSTPLVSRRCTTDNLPCLENRHNSLSSSGNSVWGRALQEGRRKKGEGRGGKGAMEGREGETKEVRGRGGREAKMAQYRERKKITSQLIKGKIIFLLARDKTEEMLRDHHPPTKHPHTPQGKMQWYLHSPHLLLLILIIYFLT